MLPSTRADRGPRSRAPRLLFACLLIAGLVAGCGAKRLKRTGEVPRRFEPEQVEGAIAAAEAALAEGRDEIALELMYVANEVPGLPTELRNRVRLLMERAANARIARLSAEEEDPAELAKLVDVQLPSQIAVSAGIEAARLYLAQEEYKKAYRVVRDIDTQYGQHHQRTAAGEIVAEAGMQLSYSTGGFLFFYRVRDTGREALEYLVLNYPLARRCDEAYWRLAEMYEEDEKWLQAIERHEELVIYHRESPYYPYSLARIPRLRLESIESPEYDRKQLVKARKELEEWLQIYVGHEVEPEVREDLEDALRRLAQSDLLIARFCRTVDNAFGHRYHAERALAEAEAAGDEVRAEKARALIAELAPGEGVLGRPEPGAEDVLPGAPLDDDPLGTGIRD